MSPIPHPIPYQGSKRRLAAFILSLIPDQTKMLVEPFAGSAAVSLAAAAGRSDIRFMLSDSLTPLSELWKLIVDAPDTVSEEYERMWMEQIPDPASYYLSIRRDFNRTGDPVSLLYLLVRCVKNSVRFNDHGEFNQSPDHRRKGMHPNKLKKNVFLASKILSGRTHIRAADYKDVLSDIPHEGAVVYMDPPYQGVSSGRDNRYYQQLDRPKFIESLEALTAWGIDYIISFDGTRGKTEIGEPLPEYLGLTRILINTGVSSQETLLGRRIDTIESVYVSPRLADIECSTAETTYSLQPNLFGAQADPVLAGSTTSQ